jgi:hypothetical protein
MADLIVEGRLLKKFETEQVSATFKKREFVIETEGQYPQPVKFDLTQDRCVILDNYQEGQRVKVSFNLRGREWNGKYFTDLNAWRLELAGGAAQPAAVKPASPQGTQPPKTHDVIEVRTAEEKDDLPF